MGRPGGLREDFHQRVGAVRRVGRAGGPREDFHQRVGAAGQVGRAGGLREDFHQTVGAVRQVGRAGGLREDFHQRAEADQGVRMVWAPDMALYTLKVGPFWRFFIETDSLENVLS